MNSTIQLQGKTIEYCLEISKRSRHVRLVVSYKGILRVIVPHQMRGFDLESCLLQRTEWILDKLMYVEQLRKKLPLTDVAPSYKQTKTEALLFVQARIHVLNQAYGYRVNGITIRDQKTRWGSCSKQGNLNFNYRIAHLPFHLADYVIVHELCHLKEMNHSTRFWDLVARVIPDYRARKKELQEQQVRFG